MPDKTTTVKEFFRNLQERLIKILPEEEVSQHAFWLLETLFGKNRTDLILNSPLRLKEDEQERLEEIFSRLERQEPVQYILGEAFFYGRKFHVRQGVLIPRPETEELVQLILSRHGQQKGLKLLDVGTGSGCIALTLALELEESVVYALDVSPEALEVAQQNAGELHAPLNFIQEDILKTIPELPTLDVVVSNPPYVRKQEAALMQANVLDWEPPLALFVEDDDPLIFYRRIAELAQQQLCPGGALYFEINEAFGQEIAEVLGAMHFEDVQLHQDMQGKPRMVSGLWPGLA